MFKILIQDRVTPNDSSVTNNQFLFSSSSMQFSLPNCWGLAFTLTNIERKRDSISVICLLKGLCSRVSNEWIYKKVDCVWRVESHTIFSNLSSFLTLCIHRRTSVMKTPAFHRKIKVRCELQTWTYAMGKELTCSNEWSTCNSLVSLRA